MLEAARWFGVTTPMPAERATIIAKRATPGQQDQHRRTTGTPSQSSQVIDTVGCSEVQWDDSRRSCRLTVILTGTKRDCAWQPEKSTTGRGTEMANDESTKGEPTDSLKNAYARRDSLARWQRGLTWLFLGGALAICTLNVVWIDPANQRHAPAPVSRVHASWQADCNKCHEPYTRLGPVFGDTHVGDQRCIDCHGGPTHHANIREGGEHSCASCHREHRGVDATLARMGDSHCIRCHAELGMHVRPGQKFSCFSSVTAFNRKGHPEFRIHREGIPDPRHLRFSHQRHMTRGLRLVADGEDFVLGQVDMAHRARYRQPGQKDNSPVQLKCESCHRLEEPDWGDTAGTEGLPQAAVRLARAAGDYMRPVLFEQHCQACHSLAFDRKDPDDARTGRGVIRHRLQPKEVRSYLESYYTEQYLKGLASKDDRPRRPLPGENPDDATKQAALEQINRQVRRVEAELFSSSKGCAECHFIERTSQSKDSGGLNLRIMPTKIPQVWLRHAKFSHASHRMHDCALCHRSAYALEPADRAEMLPQTGPKSLLPRIETCFECHGPSHAADGAKGGARYDCAGCHRYHNEDAPLQGRGAAARGPSRSGSSGP